MIASLSAKLNSITKVLAGGFVFLLALVVWLTYQISNPAEDKELMIDPGSLIVHQVREVSELTTAMFEMDAVVPVSEKWGLSKSQLLYIAHGDVRVGVDLSEFQSDDVQEEDHEITVTLPPLKVLDSKLDLFHSSVYSYDRGFLGWGPDVVDLQAQAQLEAISKVEKAACQDWLIQTASNRVQQTVEHLLSQALSSKGYKITVKAQLPSDSSCVRSHV
ncbi:MAG: DUF4230 domain-containing protein [Cyanobacteria bacterium P01_H01_bin.21]